MKRFFNYTDRKRLVNQSYNIRLDEQSGGSVIVTLSFAKELIFSEGIPENCFIWLEAYIGTKIMRFPVGNLEETTEFVGMLSAFTPQEIPAVLFRIKLLDKDSQSSRIVAWKDKISPISYDAQGNRKSLLPVRFDDLGNLIWDIDFVTNESQPVLVVNNCLSKEIVSRDVSFAALVFPRVLKEVLQHLLEDEDNPEEVENDWIKFAKNYVEIYSLSDEDSNAEKKIKRDGWIEEVIQSFAKDKDLKARYREKNQ